MAKRLGRPPVAIRNLTDASEFLQAKIINLRNQERKAVNLSLSLVIDIEELVRDSLDNVEEIKVLENRLIELEDIVDEKDDHIVSLEVELKHVEKKLTDG